MLYLIRNKSDRKLLGLFYAKSIELLTEMLDEQANPYEVEFRRLDTRGGGVWFEEITEEKHGDDDSYRYPTVGQVTFDEGTEAFVYDGYQEFIKGKDDPDAEWMQLTKNNSYGDIRSTKNMLQDACDAIEIIKEIREGDFKP